MTHARLSVLNGGAMGMQLLMPLEKTQSNILNTHLGNSPNCQITLSASYAVSMIAARIEENNNKYH